MKALVQRIFCIDLSGTKKYRGTYENSAPNGFYGLSRNYQISPLTWINAGSTDFSHWPLDNRASCVFESEREQERKKRRRKVTADAL